MAFGSGVNLKVNVNLKNLIRMADNLPVRIERGIGRIAYAAEKGAVAEAPKDKGSLASSIEVLHPFREMYIVRPNVRAEDGAPYDVFQELGTGLFAETWDGYFAPDRHWIYPRTAPKLCFEWHGEPWAVSRVRGVAPHHYMRKGLEGAMANFPRLFAEGFTSLALI